LRVDANGKWCEHTHRDYSDGDCIEDCRRRFDPFIPDDIDHLSLHEMMRCNFKLHFCAMSSAFVGLMGAGGLSAVHPADEV
jgi:hypothetical protein